MTENAVNAIAELARAAAGRTVLIDGTEYSTAELHDPRKPDPEPKPLVVHTLNALTDYIAQNKDGVGDECLVHIVSPTQVSVVGELRGRFAQRFTFASAQIVPAAASFRFGAWMPPDEMVIALQALFAENTHERGRAYVLRIVGNLRDEAVRQQSDDGVTQTVTAKAGIATLAEVAVQNPVTLAPFRTFAEIEQPESPFIIRFRKGHGGAEVALFEADGGAWKLDAIRGIAAALDGRTAALKVLA